MYIIKCPGCNKEYDADDGKARIYHHEVCKSSQIGLANSIFPVMDRLYDEIIADQEVASGARKPADVIVIKSKK